jgi:hypothetical protein
MYTKHLHMYVHTHSVGIRVRILFASGTYIDVMTKLQRNQIHPQRCPTLQKFNLKSEDMTNSCQNDCYFG